MNPWPSALYNAMKAAPVSGCLRLQLYSATQFCGLCVTEYGLCRLLKKEHLLGSVATLVAPTVSSCISLLPTTRLREELCMT